MRRRPSVNADVANAMLHRTMATNERHLVGLVTTLCCLAAPLLAQGGEAKDKVPEDIADVPSVSRKAGGDEHKHYFLIGHDPERKAPRDGYKLVLIMPGGDGGAAFEAFCRRIWKHALGDSYVAAQLVAKKWTDGQVVVWPTDGSRVDAMEFTTEQFLAAVIEDVETQLDVDRAHIFTLSWSSSGPAAYAAALAEKSRITGSFVAMSVFKPAELPPLKRAKGHAFFLLHSQDDDVCPMRMAREAEVELTQARAEVEFLEYDGGHGWHGNVWADMRKGFAWLEQKHGKARAAPKPKQQRGDR